MCPCCHYCPYCGRGGRWPQIMRPLPIVVQRPPHVTIVMADSRQAAVRALAG